MILILILILKKPKTDKIPKVKGDDKPKRSRDDDTNTNSNSDKKKKVSGDNDDNDNKPKKKKTAFGIYVKENRNLVIATLTQEGASPADADWTEKLKAKLTELWQGSSQEVFDKYNAIAEKDHERYENELKSMKKK